MGCMRLSISLPDQLVATMDVERGDVSRSLWVRRRLEAGGIRVEPVSRGRPELVGEELELGLRTHRVSCSCVVCRP
jgi:metal-responsive CopG/Arc/MetJ family transcriptional regulator